MEKFQIQIKCGCIRKGHAWPKENAIGNIVIFEGMEEHSARYDLFATYLNNKGFAVYCIDTYGQGENVQPDFSDVGKWPKGGYRKQVDIYDQLIKQLNEKTKVPTFIFAHSMGSFMLQLFLQEYPNSVNRAVMCGSGGKNAAVKLGYALAKVAIRSGNEQEKAVFFNKLMFGNFNERIPNARTPFDWLSHDEKIVDKYINDPLCGFGPRNLFCMEFLKGMKDLYESKNLKKISKDFSIFIIAGEEDPVAGYGKFTNNLAKMYKKLGMKCVESKLYPNMRHEVLNEFGWEQVAEDVAEFFKKGL